MPVTFLYNTFSFLAIFTIVVFIHEFGHYFIAKMCKVKIEVFSIGFGKKLFGFKDSSGTSWQMSLIPFGGYVKMFGEINPGNAKEKTDNLTEEEKKVAFHLKSPMQKSAIVAAGPIANLLLAVILMTFMFLHHGKAYVKPYIESVSEGSAAEEAGINPGDVITQINRHKISSFADIQRIISLNTGSPITIEYLRNGETRTTETIPKKIVRKDALDNEIKVPVLGISSGEVTHKELNIFEAFAESLKETYHISSQTLQSLGQIITGKRDSKEISGPIGIARYSGQSVRKGINTVIWFIIILSVNLGLVNFFPIPMLDGGHLLFYLTEAITRKPLPEKFQRYSFKTGIIIISLLATFAVMNDLRNLNIL